MKERKKCSEIERKFIRYGRENEKTLHKTFSFYFNIVTLTNETIGKF